MRPILRAVSARLIVGHLDPEQAGELLAAVDARGRPVTFALAEPEGLRVASPVAAGAIADGRSDALRSGKLVVETVANESVSSSRAEVCDAIVDGLRVAHRRLGAEGLDMLPHGSSGIGFCAAALVDGRVQLVIVPPAQVFVVHQGVALSVPQSDEVGRGIWMRDDLRAEIFAGVGGVHEPDIRVYDAGIVPGDSLVLVSSTLARMLTEEDVRLAVAYEEAVTGAEQLKQLAIQRGVEAGLALVVEIAGSLEEPRPGSPLSGPVALDGIPRPALKLEMPPVGSIFSTARDWLLEAVDRVQPAQREVPPAPTEDEPFDEEMLWPERPRPGDWRHASQARRINVSGTAQPGQPATFRPAPGQTEPSAAPRWPSRTATRSRLGHARPPKPFEAEASQGWRAENGLDATSNSGPRSRALLLPALARKLAAFSLRPAGPASDDGAAQAQGTPSGRLRAAGEDAYGPQASATQGLDWRSGTSAEEGHANGLNASATRGPAWRTGTAADDGDTYGPHSAATRRSGWPASAADDGNAYGPHGSAARGLGWRDTQRREAGSTGARARLTRGLSWSSRSASTPEQSTGWRGYRSAAGGGARAYRPSVAGERLLPALARTRNAVSQGLARAAARASRMDLAGKRQLLVPAVAALFVLLVLLIAVRTIRSEQARQVQQRYDSLVSAATQLDGQAKTDADKNEAQGLIRRAQALLDQANTLQPNQPRVASVRKDLQDDLNRIDGLVPLPQPAVLANFGSLGKDVNATALAADGAAFYALDTGGQRLLQDVRQSTQPGVAATKGDKAGPNQLGSVKLLTSWDSGALVLDSNRALWSYSASKPKLEQIGLKSSDTWKDATAISAYGPNLYVLDASIGNVWRYASRDGIFTDAPTRFFEKDNPDLLRQSVSLAIDGSIWVLTSDGQILKLAGGQTQPLTVTGLPQPIGKASQIATQAGFSSLYVLNGAGDRVFEIGKDGRYVRQFGLGLSAPATSIWPDQPAHQLTVLSGNQLYQYKLP